MGKQFILILVMSLIPLTSYAGKVQVISAEADKISPETYRISATLLHDDTGWNHYADKWEIIGPSGVILATRTLLHPHVDEQPFTRDLSGVKIPENIKKVTIRGHDSVHGYGEQTISVDLTH
jgi:hypothetical protein